jgi:hypothetical protein
MFKAHWTSKEFLQPASICLARTKDAHLKGTIGELVAWKYLRRYCHVWSVVAQWPVNILLGDALRSQYLKTRQVRYLKHHVLRGTYRWDFLAIRSAEFFSGNVQTRYLVEIKTGVMRKQKHGLRTFTPTLPKRSDYSKMIAEARSFGFTPILIKVGIGERWTFHVSCRELL